MSSDLVRSLRSPIRIIITRIWQACSTSKGTNYGLGTSDDAGLLEQEYDSSKGGARSHGEPGEMSLDDDQVALIVLWRFD